MQHCATRNRPPWPITPSAGRDGERALLLRLLGKHLHSTITRLYDRRRPPNHFCRDRHHPLSYAGARNPISEVIGRRRYSHPHVQRRCGRGEPSARKSYRRKGRTGRCSHPRRRSGRGSDRWPSLAACGGRGRRLELSEAYCCVREVSAVWRGPPLFCRFLLSVPCLWHSEHSTRRRDIPGDRLERWGRDLSEFKISVSGAVISPPGIA